MESTRSSIPSEQGSDNVLVLRRRVGEGIVIGKNLIVRVLSIEHGDVKLGIEAPREIKILREELYEEVVKSNVQANDFDLSKAKNVFRKEGDKNEDH